MTADLKFGTDGVRGLANRELTPRFVLSLAMAAVEELGAGPWVVGRDSRLSGPMLQAALTAGLAARGAHVLDAGMLPTPAVAHHAIELGCPAAMVSASHNPFEDNGIKFFAAGGHKLDDQTQTRIEQRLTALLETTVGSIDQDAPVGAELGTSAVLGGAAQTYVDHIATVPLSGRRLDGLKVVIDAANGAASEVAPLVMQRLGATTSVIHASPDGVNINESCGSTHPADLARAVVQRNAHVGFAFDGDADRLVAVDETGEVVDGDALLGMFALDRAELGALPNNTIVATVMSNIGLGRSLASHGIEVSECPVGDRNVLAALDANRWALGGEQSGHIIFRDLATTGDGLLAAVVLGDLLVRSKQPVSRLASVIERFPQVLHNVPVRTGKSDVVDLIANEISVASARLGENGRVLVRPSGTEPLVRVMVEAISADEAESVAQTLMAAIRQRTDSGH